MFRTIVISCLFALSCAFAPINRWAARTQRTEVNMVASQVKAAQPTIEEWLDIIEPGLRKATLGMFAACKEIAYKIRTASCDKMACFNEFGE